MMGIDLISDWAKKADIRFSLDIALEYGRLVNSAISYFVILIPGFFCRYIWHSLLYIIGTKTNASSFFSDRTIVRSMKKKTKRKFKGNARVKKIF
jgi:hypothetical protein